MEKNIDIKAKTIEEARKKLWEKIPKGFYLISVEEKRADYKYESYFGQTIEEAIEKSVKDLFPLKGEIIESANKAERIINSYGTNTNDACNTSRHGDFGLNPKYKIEEIKLIEKGKRISFFSRKRLNTYELRIIELAYVTIRCEVDARIQAELTDKKDSASKIFLKSVKYGMLTSIENLLSSGLDINVCNSNGENGLMLAIRNEQIDMALILIKKGIDIFKKDNFGSDVLLWAHPDPDQRLVRELARKGLESAKLHVKNNASDSTYCSVCKKNVKTYESSYDYDDGWFTRECTKCSICGNILSTGSTTQN